MTILQLVAAFLTIFFVVKKLPGPRLYPILLAVLGLFCSEIWLYHIERGQVYIFFALFFSLGYYLYNASFRHHEFIAGLVGGLFIFFRPIAAVAALGFLLFGKWRWVSGCITGFILGMLLFIAPQPKLWVDYILAMKEYNNELLGKPQVVHRATFTLPDVVEGSNNLSKVTEFDQHGLWSIYGYLNIYKIRFNNTHSVLLYFSLITALSIAFYRQRRTHQSPQLLYLFGFLIYILAEVCMLVPRNGYNTVQWIFALPLLYSMLSNSRALIYILIALLLFLHNFPFHLTFQVAIAEIGLIGLAGYAIFFKEKKWFQA